MNSRNLKLSLLALGLVAFGTVEAQAADITVVNTLPVLTHPYFRASCWDPAFQTARPSEWVFFGTIPAKHQFTWPQFEVLLKANCKRPVVRFAFTLDGEAAPTGRGDPNRTTKLKFDSTVPAYVITEGTIPALTSVTPDDDDDDNDD